MNATLLEPAVVADSEIADFLSACSSTTPSAQNVAFAEALRDDLLIVLESGNPGLFINAVRRTKDRMPQWRDLVAAAEHSACCSDTLPVAQFHARISAVSQLVRSAIAASGSAGVIAAAS